MSIEIREFVIKATLTQENKTGPQPGTNTQSSNSPTDNEQLINTCVEKVMTILKLKNQR